jgi:hypothetical protein
MNDNFEYGKWDQAEDWEVAYSKVKSGEWSPKRFDQWLSQVRVELWRDIESSGGFGV